MNLLQLAADYPLQAQLGVPEWMLGHFRRRTISFADGRSDERMQVHWLQSRSFTIDLRLAEGPPLPIMALADYEPQQLRTLANHEGWMADSIWADGLLSWRGGVSLQLHNRWPEPAQLRRIGNCMIEFAPSGAYVEDWRLQDCRGPLVGLRLIDERDAETGEVLHRGGGLILCGEQLGWVQGRAQVLNHAQAMLRECAEMARGDAAALAALFNCETSLALIDERGDYRVTLSTLPARIGQALSLEGFERPEGGHLQQFLERADGRSVVRHFSIDTLEPAWHSDPSTPWSPEAQSWFCTEQETLARYLTVCR